VSRAKGRCGSSSQASSAQGLVASAERHRLARPAQVQAQEILNAGGVVERKAADRRGDVLDGNVAGDDKVVLRVRSQRDAALPFGGHVPLRFFGLFLAHTGCS
jgi:hypothetical protein